MDKDEERVPHGMTLGGYDADSQQYSYFDQDGSAWASEPAKRFSTLTRGILSSSREHYCWSRTLADEKAVKTTYTDQLTNGKYRAAVQASLRECATG